MRVFNVRFAAILLVICLVSVIGVKLLNGHMVRGNAVFFLEESNKALERAKEAAKAKDPVLEEKETRIAINFLKWYLQLVPDDLDSQENLGMMLAKRSYLDDILLDKRVFMEAFQRLEELLRSAPERQAARRQLVEMAMLARRFQDAKDHLQDYLLKESPDDPKLLELLGQCQAETGKYDDARKAFKKAIETDPHLLTAYQKLADLLRGHYLLLKEADQCMEQLVKLNPKSAMAHYLRGRYLSSIEKGDQAYAEAMQAQAIDPDDSEILRLAALCHASRSEFDKARECLDHGIKLHPETIVLYTTLSEIERQSGKIDKAVDALQKGLKATGRNLYLLWCVADLMIDNNKLKDSEEILKELQTSGYNRGLIEYSRARIEYVQGHWKDAKDGFERVRGLLSTLPQYVKQVDLMLGNCYEKLGNRDLALQAYHRAQSFDSTFAPAMIAEMSLLMAMGRYDPAAEIQKKLAERGTVGPGNAIVMARILLYKTLQQAPSQRDWTTVTEILDAAEKTTPNSPEIPLMRAQILDLQDRAAEAETLLLEARDKNRKEPSYWMSLVGLAAQQKNWDKAEKLMADSEKELGDGLPYRLMQIQYVLRRYGREKEGIERLRKLDDKTERFSDTERMQLWGNLLTAAMQVNDTEQVKRLCKRIAEKEPNNVQVRYTLFEAMLNDKKIPEMEEALKDIRRVAGENAQWLYGQAALILLQAQGRPNEKEMLNQALTYLDKASELRKDWSRISLMQAAIHSQLGETEMELKCFMEALTLGERNPPVIHRTLQLLSQTQQFAEIDRRLRQFEQEKIPFTTAMNQFGAESAIRQGDFNHALELANKVAAAESKTYREQIWLGRILSDIGTRAKNENQEVMGEKLLSDAKKAFQSATELEPKLPETWLSLVQFLNSNQETTEAEKAIEEAGKKISPERAPLALAQCYEILEKADAAKERYEAALAAAPQDLPIVRAISQFYIHSGTLDAAEAQLRRILDGKVKADKSDVFWARRQLALIYVIRGKYEDIKVAKKLIDENLADSPSSVIDLRLRSRLSEADPNKGGRDDAIKDLLRLYQEKSATPEDSYKLVQLYLAQGEWLKASDMLMKLVAKDPKDPRFLIVYIQQLLQRGEISNVDMYLDRLEKLAPAWFITVSLRAEALIAKNQPTQAFELLTKYVDMEGALPAGRNTRILLLAERLEQLAHKLAASKQTPMAVQYINYAESILRDYLKESPGKELLLAEFLGRRGKTDEALELLQKGMDGSTAQTFSHASAVILHAGNPSKEQLKRLDDVNQAALKKFERPVPLLMVMAELCSQQTRYADAETYYREVLKNNNGNVVAMNNLAVLLALQGIKLDESIRLANQAIEISGPLGIMLDSRASVYVAMKDLDKAFEDISKATAEDETPVRLFHKAQILDLMGRNDEAKEAFDKSLKKGLSPKMLLPLEMPAFEKLQQLLK